MDATGGERGLAGKGPGDVALVPGIERRWKLDPGVGQVASSASQRTGSQEGGSDWR